MFARPATIIRCDHRHMDFFKTFFMVLSSNLRLFGKFYNFIFMSIFTQISSTLFENHRKGLIQYCERSELSLHLSGQKFIKNGEFGNFFKT